MFIFHYCQTVSKNGVNDDFDNDKSQITSMQYNISDYDRRNINTKGKDISVKERARKTLHASRSGLSGGVHVGVQEHPRSMVIPLINPWKKWASRIALGEAVT